MIAARPLSTTKLAAFTKDDQSPTRIDLALDFRILHLYFVVSTAQR